MFFSWTLECIPKVKRTDIHLQRYVGVGVFGNYRGVFCFLPTMGVRFLQDSQVKPARTTFFFFFSKFYLHPERLPFSSSLSLPFFLCNLRRVSSSSSTTPPSVGLQLLKQRHLIIAEATQAYVPLCVCVCVYVYVCTSYAFFVCIFCVYTAFPRMSFPLFVFNLLLIVIS